MLPNIAFILDGVPSDTMLTLFWLRCILVPLFVILFRRSLFSTVGSLTQL